MEAAVSALFAPMGPHAWTTLFLGLVFLATRVVLFIGLPGWIAARAVSAILDARGAGDATDRLRP